MSASELISVSRVNPVRIGASRGGEERVGAERAGRMEIQVSASCPGGRQATCNCPLPEASLARPSRQATPERRGRSRTHEQNGNRCRSAFSAVLEYVALTATLRAVGPAEEDDCKSSIPGGVAASRRPSASLPADPLRSRDGDSRKSPDTLNRVDSNACLGVRRSADSTRQQVMPDAVQWRFNAGKPARRCTPNPPFARRHPRDRVGSSRPTRRPT